MHKETISIFVANFLILNNAYYIGNEKMISPVLVTLVTVVAIIYVFKNKQLQWNHQSKGVMIFLEMYFRLLSIDSADEL